MDIRKPIPAHNWRDLLPWTNRRGRGLVAWALFALAAPLSATAAGAVDAVIADPPVDATHPASMAYVRIPSHGDLINGLLYKAAGAGPHPAVLLLHGFPGNEQNLDLAQAMRRGGFDVLTLHYRGSWGSPGAFSFTHAIEDADAAVAFLRLPETKAKFGVAATRIFVVGHSLGGFIASSTVARDPAIAGLVSISAWNLGAEGRMLRDDPAYRKSELADEFPEDVIPLSGTTPEELVHETISNASRWELVDFASTLRSRPALLIGADDGDYPDAQRLAERLRQLGDRDVVDLHMPTDHSYSDHRIALATAVVEWLQERMPRP